MSVTFFRVIFIIGGCALLLALLFFIWFAIRLRMVLRLKRQHRKHPAGSRIPYYCPASKSIWWTDLILPHRLFIRHACYYDLSSQKPVSTTSGEVRCPECGKVSTSRHHLYDHHRFRAGRATLALSFIAAAAFTVFGSQQGRWIQSIPTIALVGMQQAGITLHHEKDMREETLKRVIDEVKTATLALPARPQGAVAPPTGGTSRGIISAGGTSTVKAWTPPGWGWTADRLTDLLVSDLHDDRVPWNATEALPELFGLGPAVRPALIRAMASADWQQRQYAFVAFDWIERSSNPVPAEPVTIKVALEALHDDRESYFANAVSGLHYLVQHAHDDPAYAAEIVRTLKSTADAQQRLLCALVCGYASIAEGMTSAYPVLVECLENNRIFNDATAAAPAIYRFGPPVIPLLEQTLAVSKDEQQVRCIGIILFDLKAPSAPHVRPVKPEWCWQMAQPLSTLNIDKTLGFGSTSWLVEYDATH